MYKRLGKVSPWIFKELSDSAPRTPPERIDAFEQALRVILDEISRSGSNSLPSSVIDQRLAVAFQSAWSASRATLWRRTATGCFGIAVPQLQAANCEPPIPAACQDATTLRLIELASARSGILWIEASAASSARRALGAIEVLDAASDQVVLELEFDGSCATDLPVARDAILHGLEHCLQLIARYGTSFFGAVATSRDLQARVELLAIDLMFRRRLLCQQVNEQLSLLAGKQLASFREKRQLVDAVQLLLDEHGLRLVCPTCGQPAILRCMKTGNSLQGCYLFDHRIGNRRTMHGGRSEFPRLITVDKPARAKPPTASAATVRAIPAMESAKSTT